MEKALNIINNIKISSLKEAKHLLIEHYNNETLKDILKFVYNPYITTGLSTKKINKNIDMSQYNIPTAISIGQVFYYLEHHNTGKDKDIVFVKNFIANQKKEFHSILKEIFTKELKLGIKAKTINSIWDGLIPEFNLMLAEKYCEHIEELKRKEPDIIITQKLDGVRCLMVVDNDKVTMLSRQGKHIKGLIDIVEEAKELPDGCYDGELLLDIQNIDSKELYKKTVSVVNSKIEQKENIIFNIFDYVPLYEFETGKCVDVCYVRKHYLEFLMKNYLQARWIKTVPILYEGKFDEDIVNELLKQQIDKHNEGIMINYSKAPYQLKRNKYILKVKAMQDVDLKIISMIEGEGKNLNLLGAVIVDYKGFAVKVGSGFTDDDRKFFWEHKNELIGRIIKVQYFEESSDKYGNLSLRFPVFLELREEGKEVSYY